MAKVWEYWVFDTRGGPESDKDLLNAGGKDGWELVSVLDYDGERRFFLKRQILDTGWYGPK